MDVSAVVWERWKAQVKDLLPTIHGHQKKTLALFVIGIILGGKCRAATGGRKYQLTRDKSSENDKY
jgi:hypothetical protein